MTPSQLAAGCIVLLVAALSAGYGALLTWWHCKDRALVALYLEQGMRHLDYLADEAVEEERLMRAIAEVSPGRNGVVIYDMHGGREVVDWEGWPMTAGGRA